LGYEEFKVDTFICFISNIFPKTEKRASTEMEYLLKNVKLDKAEKHDLFVKAMSANKFDNITLPDHLPPLPNKPQVST
jgi:hypothetical protein